MKVRPAIATVATRVPPSFGAALTVTLPLPVPLLPFVTASHPAELVAVHAHVFAAATETIAPSPPDASVADAGEIDALHATTGTPFTATLSITAVVSMSALWLATAMPTYAFEAIAIVALPSAVHVDPVEE